MKNTFGILLTEDALKELNQALTPYLHSGLVGKYIYASDIAVRGGFIVATVNPDQVSQRIRNPMTIWIPDKFVNFVAGSSDLKKLGFDIEQDIPG